MSSNTQQPLHKSAKVPKGTKRARDATQGQVTPVAQAPSRPAGRPVAGQPTRNPTTAGATAHTQHSITATAAPRAARNAPTAALAPQQQPSVANTVGLAPQPSAAPSHPIAGRLLFLRVSRKAPPEPAGNNASGSQPQPAATEPAIAGRLVFKLPASRRVGAALLPTDGPCTCRNCVHAWAEGLAAALAAAEVRIPRSAPTPRAPTVLHLRRRATASAPAPAPAPAPAVVEDDDDGFVTTTDLDEDSDVTTTDYE